MQPFKLAKDFFNLNIQVWVMPYQWVWLVHGLLYMVEMMALSSKQVAIHWLVCAVTDTIDFIMLDKVISSI